MSRVSARHIVLALALAAAIRLPLLRAAGLWYDEATVGLTGLAVLRGELPVYFFGQPFMGALGDAYLAAPFYVLFGASARSLELFTILLGLAWIGLVVRLAWDAFGPRAALFTALLLAIPPDYLMFWAHEGRPHYLLGMTLGTLAVLLALRAPATLPRRMMFQFGLLGLVLGLVFWVNLLSLVFFPAVGILLLRRGVRWPLVRGALLAVPAFALGSFPHWLYGLRHGTATPPAGERIPLDALLGNVRLFLTDGWEVLSGVPASLRSDASGTWLGAILAVVYLAALLVAARAARRDGPVASAGVVGLLILAGTNILVVVGTQYGRGLGDPRYLLPLHTALPPLLGYGLARFAFRRIAVAVTAALLLLQAAGIADGEYQLLRPVAVAREDAWRHAVLATIAALERDGPRRLYAPDFGLRVFTFLSHERIIVSSHYEEIYPPYALAVDGAERVGWWMTRPDPDFEATLKAIGIRFTRRTVGPYSGIYTDFSVPPQGLHELDSSRFTVRASVAQETAAAIADRDAGTLWSTSGPRQGGEWIEVDLGAIEPVALVRWLPGTYQETPTGLVLEASSDGRAWQSLLDLPRYFGPLYWSAGRPMDRVRSGRLELRLPPTPARYLRFTQTGREARWPWTIRELFVYAATSGRPAPTPDVDGPTLARAIRAAGVDHLYADHGWGSRVALADPGIRIPPANLSLDAYGFVGSADAFWPRVRWRPGVGALLEPFEAEGFAATARTSGLGFTQQSVGGLVFLAYAPPPRRPGTPIPAAELTVTASRHPELGARAIDGDRATRWATLHPQTPGDWVRIDLATPRAVRAVRSWTAAPSDSARGLALEGSEDGTTWRPIAVAVSTEGTLRWGGIALLRDGVQAVRLDFAPVRLRALRLTLTRGHPVFDWSIDELTVYAAG